MHSPTALLAAALLSGLTTVTAQAALLCSSASYSGPLASAT